MTNGKGAEKAALFRDLPSVDELSRSAAGTLLQKKLGSRRVTAIARKVVEGLRTERSEREDNDAMTASKASLLASAESRLLEFCKAEERLRIQRVINATGVVIHTNLGRAPLSEKARQALIEASGYCNVEFDIEKGGRGSRGIQAERMLAELTGAESSLIVNNCAAAAFFILSAFAAGSEVIVSRGELVEIGGDFRVPDVLSQSGARLREVGTTNRTKLIDYRSAINDDTRMILRVHPSNYRIVGYTHTAKRQELAELAHQKGLIFYEDAGSGALVDVEPIGLTGEPMISSAIGDGADIVTFSGDKLLGASQAGIIVGRENLVAKLRKHPLYRTLRADKLTLAVLEATLESYVRDAAFSEIPVLRMLSVSREELTGRVTRLAETLSTSAEIDKDFRFEVISGRSAVGGGAAPAFQPETTLLAVTHERHSAERLELALRNSTPPVIARIADNKVLIDLRTVAASEEDDLSAAILNIGTLARPVIHSDLQNPS